MVEPLRAVPVVRPGLLVGRDAEFTALQQCWAQAQQGIRQVVLVTGEAGIGKTTLVDGWVAQVVASNGLWLGRGQCIEQHAAGEAYLPLLEALGRLGRGPEGAHLVQVLHQQAPSWLVHLPALVPPEVFEALERRAGGTTRERMLRELAEAVEVLTAERPLVLVLEDLHWCDVSTLDWLAYVARRREAVRLLVIGTYRPVEAIVRAHPVHAMTQELQLHGQATEVVLGPLSEVEVHAYLTRRFGEVLLPAGLAHVLHRHTDGNPFFLVTVVDDLVQQGRLQEGATSRDVLRSVETAVVGVPASVLQLLERQFEQLPPEDQDAARSGQCGGSRICCRRRGGRARPGGRSC